MHELTMCRGLIDAVERIAEREHAISVASLTVTIGALSGVEPALLARAFELARMGTIAENAELVIESMPVRIACQNCGIESDVPAQRMICKCCGAWHVRIVSGDELYLSRVEIEQDAAIERPASAALERRPRT